MIKIQYNCFLNRSGYAQSAQDYIYAIKDRYDLSILPMGNQEHLTCSKDRLQYLDSIINKHEKYDYQILHCIPDMQRRVKQLSKRIGFGTFETFDPPPVWIAMLNENDAIICPSKFLVNIFQQAGMEKPIHYIPHCLDISMFNPNVEPECKRDKFTFLFFGTWKKRKGWPQLIEAFLKEFDISDNVQLLIKTDRIMKSQQDIANLKQSLGLSLKETAPIIYEGRILTELELPRFIKSVDCLISPTLGEGFCIPGLQSMALEVPIIITNFSGCCDYATQETATLIEPNGFILLNDLDDIKQFVNKKWAYITADSVRKAMRDVILNYTNMKEKAKIGCNFVSSFFNYSITADRFDQMIESLV